tara:strand:- start:7166 stop:7414 length:249 start_codon:yes stop_codon:yes gene_type:complete
MRTRKARKLLRRGLLIARVRGHKPQLVSHSGALKLYGCQRQGCHAILEGWDNPDNVAGPMLHTNCGREIGWLRNFILKWIGF